MATQYTSIHSGVDIDKAVSYYNSLNLYGRTILSVAVSETDWKSMEEPSPTEISDKTSNYYIKIALSGSYKIGGAPSVCFVDEDGQYWSMDCVFAPLSKEGAFDPTEIQTIYCLSNKQISGAVVITCNLTDTKTITASGEVVDAISAALE